MDVRINAGILSNVLLNYNWMLAGTEKQTDPWNLASYPTFTKVFSVMFWNAGSPLWALFTRAIFHTDVCKSVSV